MGACLTCHTGVAVLDSGPGQMMLTGIIGAMIGVFASFVVNCTLVEISLSGWFAFYFGALFLLVGAGMVWRARSGDHPRPFLLGSFGALVFVSGLLCFCLSTSWFMRLSPSTKTPAFAILGVAVCFALLFSCIDVWNFVAQTCCAHGGGSGGGAPAPSVPLVSSDAQVHLVVAVSALMGLCFGFVFGALDVEDESEATMKIALLRTESVCYPLGALLGAAAAIVHSKLPSFAGAGPGGTSAGGLSGTPQTYNPVMDRDLDEEHV